MKPVMGQAGRTLAEMTTVVSILGIATIITAEALLPATKHNHAQAVQAELAGELRVARQLAMTRGRTVLVRLEPGQSRVTIEAVENGAMLRTFDFLDKGMAIESVSKGPDIFFYGSGRAATPTTISLKSVNDERLYKLTVSITGRVTLK